MSYGRNASLRDRRRRPLRGIDGVELLPRSLEIHSNLRYPGIALPRLSLFHSSPPIDRAMVAWWNALAIATPHGQRFLHRLQDRLDRGGGRSYRHSLFDQHDSIVLRTPPEFSCFHSRPLSEDLRGRPRFVGGGVRPPWRYAYGFESSQQPSLPEEIGLPVWSHSMSILP